MYPIGILLLFIIGWLVVMNISTLTTRTERIGLAFPIGTGVVTIVMALMDLVRIPLTSASLLTADVVIAALLTAALFRRREAVGKALTARPDFSWFNLVWLLLLAFVVWIEYANFAKCMFFPTYDRDSLAAFDTMGFIAAQEHTYGAMSIFRGDYMPGIHAPGSPIAYMPLVQLAYAYVYSLGAETSKIIPALMFLSFLIAFYALLCRHTSRTAAMAATLMTLLTPEMLSFSSLSGVNVIDAAYASTGVICVLTFLENDRTPALVLGSLLLALNVWCRAEGVVFVLIAMLMTFIYALRKHRWMPLLIAALALLPVVIWKIYTAAFDMTTESFIITHPFIDVEKASKIMTGAWALLSDTAHYGWTFVALLLAVLLDAWFVYKRRCTIDILNVVYIVLGIALYYLALYHIDYKWDSIENVLAYSAKRFLFCFVPLAWYFVVTCSPVAAAMRKVDEWMAR